MSILRDDCVLRHSPITNMSGTKLFAHTESWIRRRISSLTKLGEIVGQICDCPISYFSFIEGDRLWFKSRYGSWRISTVVRHLRRSTCSQGARPAQIRSTHSGPLIRFQGLAIGSRILLGLRQLPAYDLGWARGLAASGSII